MIASPADLAYFAEIANTLNVSRAAERLGISQPSLSLAMKRLEEAVGTALFLRSKRGVSLTQAGKQLLTQTRALIEAWQNIRSSALASVNDMQGSYTVGCHPSMAMRTLSAFLPGLMAAHPSLDIRIRHDISRKITEEVISMKVDIGIVVNPAQHPDLVIHRLCEDEVTFFTAEKKKYDTQDFGSGKAILVCDPELAQSQFLMREMKKKGLKYDRLLVTGSLEVAADIVANGGGIGILPSKVAERARRRLKRVPKTPVFTDEHCLIYRVENRNVRAMQAMNAAIKACFGPQD